MPPLVGTPSRLILRESLMFFGFLIYQYDKRKQKIMYDPTTFYSKNTAFYIPFIG
jgi:hypothetical protein